MNELEWGSPINPALPRVSLECRTWRIITEQLVAGSSPNLWRMEQEETAEDSQ